MPGEEEMVEDSEQGEEEEEEDSGLEYETDSPSKDSYTTPPSTRGHSEPSPAPSCLPTLWESGPENHTAPLY